MGQSLKIVFAGTPEFAALHLQALLDSEHEVVAVYSQPDRPAGRGKKLQASAVKQLATAHNIAVLQPETLKTSEAQQQLTSLAADVIVVVAYGLILPTKVLNTPKYGCINVHGSLLPKWRGAAPIQRSIWAGDDETGVTIMQMDEGLDTGPMLLKKSLPIASSDTSASLYHKLAQIGPIGLLETLNNIDTLTPEVQDNQQATHAKKLSKQEAKIDWQMDAAQIERNTRAFNPWPMAFFAIRENNIKVLAAEVIQQATTPQPGKIIQADKNGILVSTGRNALLLKTLQLPGKKPMDVQDILNGRADWFTSGTLLG